MELRIWHEAQAYLDSASHGKIESWLLFRQMCTEDVPALPSGCDTLSNAEDWDLSRAIQHMKPRSYLQILHGRRKSKPNQGINPVNTTQTVGTGTECRKLQMKSSARLRSCE